MLLFLMYLLYAMQINLIFVPVFATSWIARFHGATFTGSSECLRYQGNGEFFFPLDLMVPLPVASQDRKFVFRFVVPLGKTP